MSAKMLPLLGGLSLLFSGCCCLPPIACMIPPPLRPCPPMGMCGPMPMCPPIGVYPPVLLPRPAIVPPVALMPPAEYQNGYVPAGLPRLPHPLRAARLQRDLRQPIVRDRREHNRSYNDYAPITSSYLTNVDDTTDECNCERCREKRRKQKSPLLKLFDYSEESGESDQCLHSTRCRHNSCGFPSAESSPCACGHCSDTYVETFPSLNVQAPASTGCNCQHCQNAGASVLRNSHSWVENEVPPAMDAAIPEEGVRDVVPAPRPAEEAPEVPAPNPDPVLNPEGTRVIEPISYVDPVGGRKASTVTTADGTVTFPEEELAERVVPEMEQTVIPAEAVIHRRIQ